MARVAKSYIADRCPAILRECLQLHGGIGYTWEHDLHLYLRRVETNAAIHGGADYHRDRLAADHRPCSSRSGLKTPFQALRCVYIYAV